MAGGDVNIPSEEKFLDPLGITATELPGDEIVRVEIVIPGLKVKTKILKGFIKEPTNALIEPPEFTEWGFSVTIRLSPAGKGEVQPKNFRAKIRKLPGPIDPDKCTVEVAKEQVILLLQKKGQKRWAARLSERGLEQAEDEEIEAEDNS